MTEGTGGARPSRLASVVVVLLVLTAAGDLAADDVGPLAFLSISKACLDFAQKRMFPQTGTEFVFGHLYYASDGAGNACGWSGASRYGAFAACAPEAKKRGISVPCLPVVIDSSVAAVSYAQAKLQAGTDAWELTMASDEMRCGQEPGDRFYWLEHGFCDMKRHGPEKARGVVIWHHGIAGTMVQHLAPPALAMRLLQARGWDVIKLNRHNLGEDGYSYRRAEDRMLEEVRAQRQRGYRKVVVAGQSFGGRVALEVGTRSSDIFATVAMAPGMETSVGNSRTQAPTDERLRLAQTERVAVVFPGNDELFGNPRRGKTGGPVLAQRGRPYLLFDESADLRGHGGGTGGNFAFRYGLCLEEFLSAEVLPAGRFSCRARDGAWAVAEELLPKLPDRVKIASRPDDLPAGLRALAGYWYGVLGESIVSWALVPDGRAGLSTVYTWATAGSRGGGVYAATATGGEVTVPLPNQAVLTLRAMDDRRLRATFVPRASTSNFSLHSRAAETLTGELRRVDATE